MARTVGILGASGYAGGELLRLVAGHPELELAWAAGGTAAGQRVATLHPGLAAIAGDQRFTTYEPATADGLDVAFLALPHGHSGPLMADLRKRVGVVVDGDEIDTALDMWTGAVSASV